MEGSAETVELSDHLVLATAQDFAAFEPGDLFNIGPRLSRRAYRVVTVHGLITRATTCRPWNLVSTRPSFECVHEFLLDLARKWEFVHPSRDAASGVQWAEVTSWNEAERRRDGGAPAWR